MSFYAQHKHFENWPGYAGVYTIAKKTKARIHEVMMQPFSYRYQNIVQWEKEKRILTTEMSWQQKMQKPKTPVNWNEEIRQSMSIKTSQLYLWINGHMERRLYARLEGKISWKTMTILGRQHKWRHNKRTTKHDKSIELDKWTETMEMVICT